VTSALFAALLCGLLAAVIPGLCRADGSQEPRSDPWTWPGLDRITLAYCRFTGLPDELAVEAIGKRFRFRDFMVPALFSGKLDNVYLVDVLVIRRDRPVFLVLTSPSPVLWRIRILPGVRLAGVVANGGSDQGLIGIPAEIPHYAAHGASKDSRCPQFAAYAAGPALLEMNERVRAMTGHDIEHFQNEGQRNGRMVTFVVGADADRTTDTPLYAKDLEAEYFAPLDDVLFGQGGLERLVAIGKLRPATREDIAEWLRAAQSHLPAALVASRAPAVDGSYVVLGSLHLPDGLYGDQARSFIVPAGVPYPTGERGHNRFFSMEDFDCQPACGLGRP